jgi:glutaredoxin 3
MATQMAKIEVYTTPFCGYCTRAKQLLKKKNADFIEFDVMADGAKREEMMRRSGGRQTVPQIFIDGKHVGGSDDLYALDKSGGLDPLLSAGA